MRFGLPYRGVLLWIVPSIILFYIILWRKRGMVLRNFADSGVLPEISKSFDERKKKIRNWMIVVAVLFAILGLMRPQWGFIWREAKRHGIDIIIALDSSKSMLAEDVKPNRLDRAKLAIRDLVRKLGGDRVGLIVFSGTAFLQCPLKYILL